MVQEEEDFDFLEPIQNRRNDSFSQRKKNINNIQETVIEAPHRDVIITNELDHRKLTGDKLKEVQLKLRKETHGNFLIDLYHKGMPLTDEQLQVIVDLGLITEQEALGKKTDKHEFNDKQKVPFDKNKLHNLSAKLLEARKGIGEYQHCGFEIESSQWMPESVIKHSKEFVAWINSINDDGFQQKIHYEPLELYVQQAHNWLSDTETFEMQTTMDERWDYVKREFQRCYDNTLYFVDKYLYLKESDMEDASSMKYKAKPAHEVMLFLLDCRYSLIEGKARQIAATTTHLGYVLKKLIFNKNFFAKFVTMDVDTAEEIMEDKLKYPISMLPDYFRPSVYGDSHEGLTLGRRMPGEKGKRGGANSKFTVVAPSVSAINAGAPPLVLVDEAGYIKVLGKMLREARPTMFRQNFVTGELEMIRQVVVWSTGGTEEGQKKVKTKAFEEEVNHALEKWAEGSYDYGIIPVFFDWTTRPGISLEFYEREKRNYTSGEESEREQRMNQFRLTYPSTWKDMFLTESKLLMPVSWIQENEDRINRSGMAFKPQPGYFEPIIDQTQQTRNHNDDFPGKIIGARFIPLEYSDTTASAWMFMPPEKGWVNRYYKGTDPIMTDTGYSNMASVIFDKHLSTIACIINYRNENHKQTFLQTFLMGLYFNVEDSESGIPELVEANIGTAYIDYVDHLGYYRSLVHQTELPDAFQGGGQVIGIDNKGRRTEFIISRMKEAITLLNDKIYYLQIFQQLRTFSCTMTPTGGTTWGVMDKRRYKDDVLFAFVFAYICSLCYDREPRKLGVTDDKYVVTYDEVIGADGNLTRLPRRKRLY